MPWPRRPAFCSSNIQATFSFRVFALAVLIAWYLRLSDLGLAGFFFSFKSQLKKKYILFSEATLFTGTPRSCFICYISQCLLSWLSRICLVLSYWGILPLSTSHWRWASCKQAFVNTGQSQRSNTKKHKLVNRRPWDRILLSIYILQ